MAFRERLIRHRSGRPRPQSAGTRSGANLALMDTSVDRLSSPGEGRPENRPPTSRRAAILGAATRAMGGTGGLREAPTQGPPKGTRSRHSTPARCPSPRHCRGPQPSIAVPYSGCSTPPLRLGGLILRCQLSFAALMIQSRSLSCAPLRCAAAGPALQHASPHRVATRPETCVDMPLPART
jgi:hypothetical protein